MKSKIFSTAEWLWKKMNQRVTCLILMMLSVLHYYLFSENAPVGWKSLHSQQEGTCKLFHKCQKRINMSFWWCVFSTNVPLLEQLLPPVRIFDRNFSLKRESKKGKATHNGNGENRFRERERNTERVKKKILVRGEKIKLLDETSRWECWLYPTALTNHNMNFSVKA